MKGQVKPPLPTRTLRHARALRREMTDAERLLWRHLRGGQLKGLKFRRQHPIPPYIADFCCVELKLIIELDGGQHSEQSDATRTKFLESQGWRVVRYWDNEVLTQIEAVVEAIWNIASHRTLTPTPFSHRDFLRSPVGEGL
ncbi:endonuclease domain-containing protein [Pseudoxanthomonas winnipegensis]|uniref:endonuclease domain-containing protein n=1 Tax=Pseudoxanthomonas winnipegensis TaxID=2480810 RepID=UPI00103AD053|nr:endonuclease domain-containing protein [Pseudoxanthomonas winnipegensis]TBV74434.1 endonuclease domain-containing protein [Pseudoxanthomonas winnipegensis]